MSPGIRDYWDAWNNNPVSVANRRLIYRIFTPLSFVGLVLMLAMNEWVGAVFAIAILLIAISAGIRTPGSYLARLRERRKGRDKLA
jgi:hypothetical protein